MTNWLLENYLVVLGATALVVGTASTVAAAIAPLTKTDADDKLAKALRWLYTSLRKLGLNDLAPPK